MTGTVERENKTKVDPKIAQEVLRVRFSQMLVNQANKAKQFKIPIHLAFGHEAIAVAMVNVLSEQDWLLLTHRNIHYNLARSRSLRKKVDEYLGKECGEAGGQLGCMNFYVESVGNLYTSSILGNQMGVAAGVALGNRVKARSGVLGVILGDGAIEEGIFYESVLMMKTYKGKVLIIVENNGWSLGTRIEERRCDIKLDLWAASLGVPYYHLQGNDVYPYIQLLKQAYHRAEAEETPVIVEVALQTLGDWYMKTDDFPNGKYINYHAGPAPTVDLTDRAVIEERDSDPVHVLRQHFEPDEWNAMSQNVLDNLRRELA
jgi:TPP-dependent pyruvate/acetoin dehydrogenase alpha subunit